MGGASGLWCYSVATACSLQVSIAGVTTNYSGIYQTTMSFTDQSFVFTPSSTGATLSFTDTTNRGGNGGPAIDDIRITTNGSSGVPEPASAFLVLCGAGTLAALAKRRRQSL